ncbi:hypothetical protein LJC20_05550 [Eubacteriales bacterium OttesenSCG-928-M02]|nr:hypothetical protein [Eubacteriales bacterium OttesenSCG-928-M02]
MAKSKKNKKAKGAHEERSASIQPDVLDGNFPQSQEDASYTKNQKKR